MRSVQVHDVLAGGEMDDALDLGPYGFEPGVSAIHAQISGYVEDGRGEGVVLVGWHHLRTLGWCYVEEMDVEIVQNE